MSIITPEERKDLKTQMINLLEQYNYNWSHGALNIIIDTWEHNKAPFINAFKKHPNYVEGKFMIVFSAEYERAINSGPSEDFGLYVLRNIHQGNVKIPKEIEEQKIAQGCQWLPRQLYNFFYNLRAYAERTITESTAQKLNRMVPEVHAHPGQKTSRVINKLCTYLGVSKLDDYNKEFAKYADSLSPLKITRHTVLSVNPMDYLTMSFGNSWASCHTIDKENKRGMPNSYEGQYSSGTMSYLLDGTSMVFYTVDSAYNGTNFFSQPKITRQMFHYGEDKLVQGRAYPQSNDYATEIYTQYRAIVQKIMSEVFEFPNLWTVSYGTEAASKYIWSEGTHYPDYDYQSDCTLSRIKGTENTQNICVGHDPICIECGNEHTNSDNINCCTNGCSYYCTDCGDWIDETEVYWINGDPYCCDCVIYCENCNQYEPRSNSHYIESEGIDVCEYCYEHYYEECCRCGDVHHRDEMIYLNYYNEYVCEACLDSHYAECDVCGEYVEVEDMYEDNGKHYCFRCHDKIIEDTDEAC